MAWIDETPDGIFILGADDDCVRWANASFARMVGRDQGQLDGLSLTDLRGGAAPPRTPVALTRGPEKSWVSHEEFETDDGSKRPFMIHWRQAAGSDVVIASARPGKVALRLAEAREKLADEILRIGRMLPDVLFSCEKRKDGKIYWTLNEGRLAEEFHVTTEEIRGKPLEELFPGGASEKIRSEFEAAFEGEAKEWVNEMGGRYFKHYPQPVIGPDGNVERVVGFITEVTEITKAAQAVEQLADQLKHRVEELDTANRQLESFSYTVSHDLRTPLAVIDTLSQVLRLKYADVLDDDGLEHLHRLRRAAQRMNGLISDILVLSRATQSELIMNDVDLSALARDLIAEFQQKDPNRTVEVVIEDEMTVRGDPRFLSVVLQNLLSNAWKYSSKTHRPRIEVGHRVGDGQTVFHVRDNGAGFDPAHADSLFVAFQRLHTAEEFEGIGIGLATVKKIIDRHGGRIWAESSPGNGATFYFTIGESNQ